LKIGDLDLSLAIAKIDESYAKSTLRELISRRALLSRLEGEPGKSVDVEFLDGRDQRITKTLRHEKPKGTLAQYLAIFIPHMYGSIHRRSAEATSDTLALICSSIRPV